MRYFMLLVIKITVKPLAAPKDCTNCNSTKKLKKQQYSKTTPANKDECAALLLQRHSELHVGDMLCAINCVMCLSVTHLTTPALSHNTQLICQIFLLKMMEKLVHRHTRD
jgi:hypothetical protein